MLPIKGSANALPGHFISVLETEHLVSGTSLGYFIVGRKRVLSQDLAATSNSKNAFLSFA